MQHCAGRVEYRTDGWLDKNRDPLNDNIGRTLASSSEKGIASLFSEYADAPVFGAGTLGKRVGVVKKGAFRTVGQRHKEQLMNLMSQLRSTSPHFVRCIVPNSFKAPGKLDPSLVWSKYDAMAYSKAFVLLVAVIQIDFHLASSVHAMHHWSHLALYPRDTWTAALLLSV